jgi:hypothetical protein
MLLRENSAPVARILGIVCLVQSAKLVSDAVREAPDLSRVASPELLAIVRPMDFAERRLSRGIEIDVRYASDLLSDEVTHRRDRPIGERAYSWLLLKPNASRNLVYSLAREWLTLDRAPTADYLRAETATIARLQRRVPKVPSLDLAYNPTGKVIAAIAYGDHWPKYFRRSIDADGLLRLVSLQVQIAAAGLKGDDIPVFLAESNPRYFDPYSGKPMQWDKTRGLYFRGYSDRLPDKDGFVAVKL